jgi:hypothetical protein
MSSWYLAIASNPNYQTKDTRPKKTQRELYSQRETYTNSPLSPRNPDLLGSKVGPHETISDMATSGNL